jgi:hypothetical protein
MNNFTPLKPAEKKKRKFNKFLIFGNLFLVILVAAIGFFYYNKTLIPIKQKANPVWCEDVTWDNTALGGCQNVCEGTNCCLKEKQCDISGNGFCNSPDGNQCDDDQWCLMDDSTCPGGGGGGGGDLPTCPNGQPPTCETPEVTTCVRLVNCPIPNKILVDRGFCGEDPPKITCQTNCTCETAVTPTPTPTPVVTEITMTPTPTICVPITEIACVDSCGQTRQCISDGCGGELCCPATSPCPSVTPTPTGIIIPSNTPTPTRTPTPTHTPTLTPTTPPGQPTNTPAPTATNTPPAPTATNTPGPSATPTPTNVPGAPTATPTEIILAQTTVTSPPSVPVTGMVQSFMYLIPALIMLIGLIL